MCCLVTCKVLVFEAGTRQHFVREALVVKWDWVSMSVGRHCIPAFFFFFAVIVGQMLFVPRGLLVEEQKCFGCDVDRVDSVAVSWNDGGQSYHCHGKSTNFCVWWGSHPGKSVVLQVPELVLLIGGIVVQGGVEPGSFCVVAAGHSVELGRCHAERRPRAERETHCVGGSRHGCFLGLTGSSRSIRSWDQTPRS